MELKSTQRKAETSFKEESTLVTIFLFFLLVNISWSQAGIPFEIKNNSPYPDDQLYVAIVGEDLTGPPGVHVWVNLKTGVQNPMSPSFNTIVGPVYGGNAGPGNNGMYANCFIKLSDIPSKTVSLAPIQGCRLFIAVGQQLYLYFFGALGAPSGYSSPNSTDPTDPNKDIIYEIIELTYNQYGFWGNTTRVDSYNYPMGLELFGSNNFYQRTGELKNHIDIGAAFKASAPIEFQGCYNPASGAILFPTKTKDFADGTVGTIPNIGPYVDYMKPYIDAIWSKYTNEDLIFDAGSAGVWKGRVQNQQLIMTCQSGGFSGRKGIIDKPPTTHEAFEGKGVLNKVIQDATTDLLVQAQICAAITRHVINTTTPNVGSQNWSDPSKYYLNSPCNYYAKFWHQQGISVNQLSYGFAYDDVFNQSSTLYNSSPTKVIGTFGGFVDTTATAIDTKDLPAILCSVYPNPSKGQVTIDVPGNEEYTFLINDQEGKTQYEATARSTQKFELGNLLSPGVYLIYLHTQYGFSVKKLVVNKYK